MSGKVRGDPQYGGVSQTVTCNFDSLSYVELFAGAKGNGGQYRADVWVDGHESAWSNGTQTQNESWVKFDSWNRRFAFTKGKQYEFQFSRGSNDSIQFYYDDDPYKYGQLIVGQQAYPDRDLACRVFGRMDTITPDWWAICPACPWNHPEQLGTWRAIMETLGVKRADFSIYWNAIEKTRGTFTFDDSSYRHDTVAAWLHGRVGCVLDARPQQCPAWASSRLDIDSAGDTVMSPYCPPLNLFRPALDSSNYWGRFIGRTIQHYDALGDTIHIWTGLNEPNDTTTDTATLKWNTGWWRRPNVDSAYPGLGAGARPLCSLYVRLCQVTESVIHHGGIPGHTGDTILIGSTSRVREIDREGVVRGDTWIWMCYDIGTAHGTRAPFWTGVAVHAYQGWQPPNAEFNADYYELDAKRVHQLMDTFPGPVWNQEFGYWDTFNVAKEQGARNLAQAYVVTSGSQAMPEGGFENLMWFDLGLIVSCGTGWSPCYPAFYAYTQVRRRLTGLRFNGRVMTEDAGDSHIRLYEFEDPASLKKTWVCWSNGEGEGGIPVVGLPVRSDTTYVESLAYNNTPPSNDTTAAATGWLWPSLFSRPAFITEKTAVSRPELVAESLWLSPLWSGLPCIETVHVRIKNRDSQRRTPIGCATWVRLTWNDSMVDSACWTAPINPNQTVVESFAWQLPEWFHGDGLLAANVNPGMAYVEREGTDDNQAYQGSSLGTW